MLDRLIVITAPHCIPQEVEIWLQLFNLGLQKLHLRKPGWDNGNLVDLIEQVPMCWRKRIVVHHHANVMQQTGAGGVHFSYPSKNKLGSSGYTVSYSVHSWTELKSIIHHCDYVLISPVYNSISKKGYGQNKSLISIPEELIGKKIFALGGINDQNINNVFQMGYYGVALLGYFWEEPNTVIDKWKQLQLKWNQ
jgi:thiamine-phosphate pyrophosphorylase